MISRAKKHIWRHLWRLYFDFLKFSYFIWSKISWKNRAWSQNLILGLKNCFLLKNNTRNWFLMPKNIYGDTYDAYILIFWNFHILTGSKNGENGRGHFRHVGTTFEIASGHFLILGDYMSIFWKWQPFIQKRFSKLLTDSTMYVARQSNASYSSFLHMALANIT